MLNRMTDVCKYQPRINNILVYGLGGPFGKGDLTILGTHHSDKLGGYRSSIVEKQGEKQETTN